MQIPSSDAYKPRFPTLPEAIAFVTAAEKDPSASPYDFGAVPPFSTEILKGGLASIPNPDYMAARYELSFYVDRPDASQIEEMNKGL